VVLVVAGLGLAAASNAPAAPAGNVAAAAPTAGPSTADPVAGLRGGRGRGRLLGLGRHLVHASVTVTDRNGQLVNLQLDHGTVQSIGNGTLTISETGGGTEVVSTDDATRVFLGRSTGKLDDVNVGAEVFVQSRLDAG